jgi:hypothetical protein
MGNSLKICVFLSRSEGQGQNEEAFVCKFVISGELRWPELGRGDT